MKTQLPRNDSVICLPFRSYCIGVISFLKQLNFCLLLRNIWNFPLTSKYKYDSRSSKSAFSWQESQEWKKQRKPWNNIASIHEQRRSQLQGFPVKLRSNLFTLTSYSLSLLRIIFLQHLLTGFIQPVINMNFSPGVYRFESCCHRQISPVTISSIKLKQHF